MKNESILVGVVIVNYNKTEFTRECIQSVLASTYKNLRIFIVENGSNPAEKSLLKSAAFPEKVVLIDLLENSGFCRGTNVGTLQAIKEKCNAVLWLNNDTKVHPDCIESLVRTSQQSNHTGVTTGKILYEYDSRILWYAGGYLDYFQGIGKHCGHGRTDAPQFNVPHNVSYVTGCLTFIPTKILQKVGLLKEQFFTYMDDTEYSFRLKKNHVKIRYEPAASVIHRLGSGVNIQDYSPLYLYFTTRNRPYVVNLFLYRYYLFFVTFMVTFIKMVTICLRPGERKKTKIKALFIGYIDALRFKGAPLKGYDWLYTRN